MSFTVTLNGQVLNNEPQGLADGSQISIVRDEVFTGLFTTLVSNLTFWGDGYDILMAAIETVGICQTVPIQIVENCDTEPIEFEGIIFLSDIEIDEFRCQATVSVEDNTFGSLISRLKDVKVRVNNGLTLNGESLTSIGDNLDAGGTVRVQQWFSLPDLFQHVLDYLTDNQMNVVSTFFATDYRPHIVEISFFSGSALGGLVRYRYEDSLGIVNQIDTIISAGLTDSQMAEAFAEGISGGSSFGTAARGIDSFRVSVSGDTVTIYYISPISIQTINVPFGSAANAVTTQVATYGGQNVYITPGSHIKGEDQVFTISLSDLISIGGFYNLSYEPRLNGSQQELVIEQERNFFNNTTTATLSEVKTKKTLTNKLSFASLDYAQQNEDNTFAFFKAQSYVSQSCAPENITIPGAVNVPNGILPSNAAGASDDRLYLAERMPSTSDIAAYQSTFLSGGSIVNGAVFYAASIANHLVAFNYVNRAPEGMTFEGTLIVNPYSIKPATSTSFEYPLTKAQFLAILANKQGKIVFNGKNGWISNLDFNIKTGMTTFELLTE